jgi:putative ABC transport system ATP-binding protein
MPDERPIIRVRDLTKSYRLGEETVYALAGVSLDVAEGEYVAIMGASGSGKSTLMNILGCLDRPSSGTYELDGVDVASLSDDDLSTVRSEKIGFVFQNYNLLPRMRAVDQVMVPLIYQRGADREARAITALQRVGLGQRLWHRPTEMSGGQQQRVAIARALVTNPSVLFADEPTGNLDSRVSEEILALLQELNDGGVTIMMVTHEPDVAQCAKRIVQIGDGRVIADMPVTDRRHPHHLAAPLPEDIDASEEQASTAQHEAVQPAAVLPAGGGA